MRCTIAALAACASTASIVSAQNTTVDIDAISVAVPTTVFNLPVVYVTAENVAPVTATTLAVTATASSDPSATNVFDSQADVSEALSSASVLATATATADVQKRAATTTSAATTCVAQPTGIAYNSSPDSAAGFASDTYYGTISNGTASPSGYTLSFAGLTASNSADNYMGYTLLTSYDVPTCASKCTAISGCNAFNIYYERDPSVNPDDSSCSNPNSTINVKCVFWGGAVTAANANNYGQWRNQFQVLIAGSNGYINTVYAQALASGTVSSTTTAPTSQETDTAGYTYDIYSGYDSDQGAYSNTQASSSYKDCETACDADTTCNAFTYVGGANGVGSGTCWLKSKLGNPTSGASNVVSGSKTGKLNTLTIVSAFYADLDVTTQAKKAFQSGLNFVVNTANLPSTLGVADPWSGMTKSLTILYTNGTTSRVFIATDSSGSYTLAPAGSSSAPNCADTFIQPSAAGANKVFSINWGKAEITAQSIYTNFNNYLSAKSQWTTSNTLFGTDTWVGIEKSGVIYYVKSDGSSIGSKGVREYQTYTF